MEFDVIIGIETHIQLNTDTKMFCQCSTASWQADPNTLTCPTCLGLPGALPVANKKAIDKAILVGLALNSTIASHAHFDRKNYFYPDLAKAYQITQYEQPLAIGGYIEVDGQPIELVRAHLEEDVGKLSHQGQYSLVNFNKGGTPLLEIVSKPVMHSAAQAKSYVQALRQLARYIGVNEGSLEKGVMRADINISLQEKGKWRNQDDGLVGVDGYLLNNRVEVKNVNSFKAIERAVEYEVGRQAEFLKSGQPIIQETRGWDEAKGKTMGQRSKEDAHDYRYFPEPDIPPLAIDRQWVESIRATLPEMPQAKKQRFVGQYGLSNYDAQLLTEERVSADWYEQAVQQLDQMTQQDHQAAAKTVANWLLGEVAKLNNQAQQSIDQSQLTPQALSELLAMVDKQAISAASAKQVLVDMYQTGQSPAQLVQALGLQQIDSQDQLIPIIDQVIRDNQDAVNNIKNGKMSAAQFLVGQVMKQTRGQAKPDTVRRVLAKQLGLDLE